MNKFSGLVLSMSVLATLTVWKMPELRSATQSTPTTADLQVRLQHLEDRAAIHDLLMDYGRALDGRDFTLYSQMFAADGEWVGSIGSFKGPAAIKAAMEKAFEVPAGVAPGPASIHLLTNVVIAVNGDRATAVSKWTFIRLANRTPAIANIGRYDDTLVRERGKWKFLKRVAPSALTEM